MIVVEVLVDLVLLWHPGYPVGPEFLIEERQREALILTDFGQDGCHVPTGPGIPFSPFSPGSVAPGGPMSPMGPGLPGGPG